MSTTLSRRAFLAGANAALATMAAGSAFGRPVDVDYMVQQLLRGAEATPGRVKLGLPLATDSGTTVPLTITFDADSQQPPEASAVHVFGGENPRPKIVAVYFTPKLGRAELSTRIRLNGSQTVTAIAKAADGSYWRTDEHVGVTFGACAQVGSGPGPGPDFMPTMRISVPASAQPGEIVPIRTMILHPMETGLRLNDRTTAVPLRIIERFTCRVNGEEALRVQLEPAISTNPYFAFPLRIEKSGPIEFEWLDTTGAIYRDGAEIAVA